MARSVGLFIVLCMAFCGIGITDAGEEEDFKDELKDIGLMNPYIDFYLGEVEKLLEDEEEAEMSDEKLARLEQIQEKKEAWRNRLDRLDILVSTMEQFNHDESQTDLILKGLSGDILNTMNEDVLKIRKEVNGMKKRLDDSIDSVDTVLSSVKRSAVSRNVKVAGVVLYGGIGSACTFSTDCVLGHSECRHGMCQCDAGLSFDSLRNMCTKDCRIYGNTYQYTENMYIQGYNNKTLQETSQAECRHECEKDDIGFVCRSMDYFPDWKSCYLSEFTRSEVPDSSWMYNGFSVHLQRDCAYTE